MVLWLDTVIPALSHWDYCGGNTEYYVCGCYQFRKCVWDAFLGSVTVSWLITYASVSHHCHYNLWWHQIAWLVFLECPNRCFSIDIYCHRSFWLIWLLLNLFLTQRWVLWRCPLAAALSFGDLPLNASLHQLLCWMNALLNRAALWLYICICLSA